ncbi:hypothetical protein [Mycobacteroides abscessus]|uniref:hypothetical protein n=1 Tax=Mycobacteroides abscessus TaxID=36809 RepID=UPI000C2664E6|nr:hypothetical protein [Mycobacteroides abscessus]
MTEEPLQERVVEVADRETTVAKLVEALAVLKTGRNNGEETIGLLAPMRRAAAEGIADLGFRYVEAVATQRVVPPRPSWLGPHAVGHTASIDPEAAASALDEFHPDLAERIRNASTDEERAALREELAPTVAETLRTAVDLDSAVGDLRTQGRYDTAKTRESAEAKERGEDESC